MSDSSSRDLPPQLSNHQQFILAYVRQRERLNRSFIWARMPDTIYPERISRALAAEFDVDGDRIDEPDDPLPEIARALDEGRDVHADRIYRQTLTSAGSNTRFRHVRPNHSAAFSRSLARLEDRELIVRERGKGHREPTTVAVRLTDEGREVAEEILRRHGDGRYNLRFKTLEK